MGKLLINFTQALDHLRVGQDVTVPTGTGKITKADATGIDVEIELPGAVTINHYDASCVDMFEIEEADASIELRRLVTVSTMTIEQRFDALMEEIEELRAQIIVLEIAAQID